jgi:hypothetical protein
MSFLHDTTGRLGLAAFFGHFSELEQFSVSSPFSPQPPVTQAVRPFVAHKEMEKKLSRSAWV